MGTSYMGLHRRVSFIASSLINAKLYRIFPTRIRDYGMAIAVMMTWVCNFVVSKETPIIVLNIGWKTWMVSLSDNRAPSFEIG